MRGIAIGQYVRALLAGGIAAGVDLEEMGDAQFRRTGVIVVIDMRHHTVVLEDVLDNTHTCWLASVEHLDPATIEDEFTRNWAVQRGTALGYVLRTAEVAA